MNVELISVVNSFTAPMILFWRKWRKNTC